MDYSIDTGLFTNNMLPPDKRTPVMQQWVKKLLSGIAWLNGNALVNYPDPSGITYGTFIPSSSYSSGDIVYYRYALYQRLYSDNYVVGTLPTDTNHFALILPVFIGVNERLCYNGTTLTLTWALNKYFNTTFRQPTSAYGQTPLSDIYIINFSSNAQSFIVGATEVDSSAVGATISSGFVMDTLSNDPFSDFAIYIPQVVFNGINDLPVIPTQGSGISIDSTVTAREKIIRAFVDRYIVAGVNYSIHTY